MKPAFTIRFAFDVHPRRKGKNYFPFSISARVSVELQIAIQTLVSPRFHRFHYAQAQCFGKHLSKRRFSIGTGRKVVPPRFHRGFTMRRHSMSRPPFWAPEIFRANRQTQQIGHRQICWKLACTQSQRRRRRNPGRIMTLLAKPPLSAEQCPATQRNLHLPWKSGKEEIKFRRLMWLCKEA